MQEIYDAEHTWRTSAADRHKYQKRPQVEDKSDLPTLENIGTELNYVKTMSIRSATPASPYQDTKPLHTGTELNYVNKVCNTCVPLSRH